MSNTAVQIIEASAVIIAIYLVLTINKGQAAKSVIGAGGGVFTQGVGALMGPSPNRITRGGQ